MLTATLTCDRDHNGTDKVGVHPLSDGTINLSHGEAEPLKGPTGVGTGQLSDMAVALSKLVNQLSERFGTDFTEADQLLFDQERATAEQDDKMVEAAKANNLANFFTFFGRILDELFVQRMDGNDEIFRRVMSDKQFRSVAQEHLAQEAFRRIHQGASTDTPAGED
jgi:type I restriction enzyme R subunit